MSNVKPFPTRKTASVSDPDGFVTRQECADAVAAVTDTLTGVMHQQADILTEQAKLLANHQKLIAGLCSVVNKLLKAEAK